MADGTTKALDRIKVGDKVRAVEPKTGKATVRTVCRVWANHDTVLMDVTVRSGGQDSVIHATQHHLIWDVTVGDWVEAEDLTVGDVLRPVDGSGMTVVSVTLVPGRADMWDLTIDRDHDFYVVSVDGTVLVHNEGGSASGAIFRTGRYVFQIYANDHGPAHGHLKGNRFDIQIGQNDKPLDSDVELNSEQQRVVDDNLRKIRSSIGKKMAEYRMNNCG